MALSTTLPRAQSSTTTAELRAPKPYLNPYLAGVGIGVVLLLAFVIMGRGLGASGAFSSVVASGMRASGASENAAIPRRIRNTAVARLAGP